MTVLHIDPIIMTWLTLGAACICSFMIGRNSQPATEIVIESTIQHLIDSGYVKARQTADGDWDLIKLDDQ